MDTLTPDPYCPEHGSRPTAYDDCSCPARTPRPPQVYAAQDCRRSLSANAVRVQLHGLTDAIDTAHAHGMEIPPKVAEALAVVGALAAAWEFNARGVPAPDHIKALLGLAVVEGGDT